MTKCIKLYHRAIILFFALFLLFNLQSCSPKSGCPASENATAKVNRKGELSAKRGKSQLFAPNGAQKVKKAQKRRKKQKRKLYAKRRS
ncbi:MAG: hypothetical protein AAGI23_07630 [Bacteroidota bacterium]